MNKTLALLASVAAFAIAAPSFAAEKESFESKTKIEQDSKGNYDAKTKTEKTDAAGTTTTSEKKVEVDVDSDGSVDKTVKAVESVDPKGLLNKETTKVTDTAKTTTDGLTKTTHEKVVNGKKVEGHVEVK